jgi:AAA ATPase-like protein/adenylate/guanylate cyclase family protein
MAFSFISAARWRTRTTPKAVRAALELIAMVSAIEAPVPLHIRIGIATGMVVVGEPVRSAQLPERGVVGETPNLATRLQGIAEPNSVVIAEGTRKLLGNLFELQEVAAKGLDNFASPLRAWAVMRASSIESRFDALHAGVLTSLIGREEECELLLRRWAKAKAGEGQVVLLSGEPGIGKSRLTVALLERLSEPHMRLRYFCSPQHTESALYPVIGLMERAAGFAHGDSAKTKLDKLDAMLAHTATSPQDAALLAEILSLPNDGRYPVFDLALPLRRQRTLPALMGQSRRSPAIRRA